VKRLLKEQKGFTLIELLIVIVILGVLAAAIIPNLSRFTSSGKLGAANAEVASVKTAIAAYMSEHNSSVPADEDAGTAGLQVKSPSVIDAYMSSVIKGTYTFAAITGEVLGGTHPDCPDTGATDYHWDATNDIFVKD
jgi:prepilin-type N-terminal cleavage/methylation domain-containing protein